MFGIVTNRQLGQLFSIIADANCKAGLVLSGQLSEIAATQKAMESKLAAILVQGGKIMSALSDLQASVASLTTAAANLITLETAAIVAANSNSDNAGVEAAVANINSITASLTAAAAALPSATVPVTVADATATLAPAP